jgi:hypothetical protein
MTRATRESLYNGDKSDRSVEKGLKRSAPGHGQRAKDRRLPKGPPDKATVEAKTACSRLVDDPAYIKLVTRLRAGTIAPAVECMLWHDAKGKPVERVS